MDQEKEWNKYWKKKRRESAYSFIASIYRTYIIKRTLNYFIFNNFKKKSKLLHAGCGSGQVDMSLSKCMNITALDISSEALKLYKKNNPSSKVIKGSIFKITAKDHSFEGIYNLGVMEHFTEQEINSILKEFKRVLTPNGKIILFWPPTFGITVRALKLIHFALNKILHLNVKLHPDEITLINSREHVEEIMSRNGFKIEKYYFGPRDFFTHVIVICRLNRK